jgi:single-stranded DNA-binding protein
MSLNRVILIGHIGNDFDLKQTDSGNPVVNFRLAPKSLSG